MKLSSSDHVGAKNFIIMFNWALVWVVVHIYKARQSLRCTNSEAKQLQRIWKLFFLKRIIDVDLLLSRPCECQEFHYCVLIENKYE